MDEWVSSARLVVPWQDVEDLVADENSMLYLLSVQPPAPDLPTTQALQTAYFAVPDDCVTFEVNNRRPLEATVDEFVRNTDRLPLAVEDLVSSLGAYVDSDGALHVGQQATLALARALCAQYPSEVLAYAADELARVDGRQ